MWSGLKKSCPPGAATLSVKTETLSALEQKTKFQNKVVQQHVSTSGNKGIGEAMAEVLHCVT